MNGVVGIAIVNFLHIVVNIYLFQFGYYEQFYAENFDMGGTGILPVMLLVITIAGDVVISYIILFLEMNIGMSVITTATGQLLFEFLAAVLIAIVSIIVVFLITAIMAILGIVFAFMIIAAFASSC